MLKLKFKVEILYKWDLFDRKWIIQWELKVQIVGQQDLNDYYK